ncbi:MAG: cation diffusion facilitator family transporter [Lachnospiraceae bacterium]|nr:cation diffusion facilitator family transporter [Lachnospiraceae bacterium]
MDEVEANIANREKVIVKTSIVGIIANVALAGFKAVIGLMANSIAITLDAVNNLSDALSSIITIVGTKLAGKAPDKKHPLGYGRIEYLTAMIVAGIVLYAGITSLTESVKKIIHPESADYTLVSLIIIAAAIVVKLFLGAFFKKRGKDVNSQSLIASGSDASFDAILSASVLASAIIFMLTKVSLEAYVGAVIAVIIIKSGIEMMIETLNDILGQRTDPALVGAIKKTITEDPEVHGAYDLFLYNYGPDKNYGSVHVEVDDTLTAVEIDELDRRVQMAVYMKHGVILTGIGLYARNTGDNEAAKMRNSVLEKVMAHDYAMSFHGFYADPEKKAMSFDVVLSFDCDRTEAVKEICSEVQEMYPDWQIQVQPDVYITDD